jgi:hypothetical protein
MPAKRGQKKGQKRGREFLVLPPSSQQGHENETIDVAPQIQKGNNHVNSLSNRPSEFEAAR